VRAVVRRILWVSFVSCALVGHILSWIPTWRCSTAQATLGIVAFDLAFVLVISKRLTLGSAALILLTLIVAVGRCLPDLWFMLTFGAP
jgi:hypothetical protein